MGPTNPGTKCCNSTTLYKSDYLCGTCTQDGIKCANATACAATCCAGTSVQDAAGQHYCGCAGVLRVEESVRPAVASDHGSLKSVPPQALASFTCLQVCD